MYILLHLLASPLQASQDLLQDLSMYDGFLEHSPASAHEAQYLFSSSQFAIGGVAIVVVVVVVTEKNN